MCKKNPQERIHAFEFVAELGKVGENLEYMKNRIQELEKEIVRLRNLLIENIIAEVWMYLLIRCGCYRTTQNGMDF